MANAIKAFCVSLAILIFLFPASLRPTPLSPATSTARHTTFCPRRTITSRATSPSAKGSTAASTLAPPSTARTPTSSSSTRTRKRSASCIDTNKLCGLTATGYAAQAKIHTRNFVGPSGKIYVGSKQGYRQKGDDSEYPGGYVMVYDPRHGQGQNLGMPFKGQGVIDVVADESRGLLYAVTCEDQHWMLGDLKGGAYRELGPLLTPYASTLSTPTAAPTRLTNNFQLARLRPGDRQGHDTARSTSTATASRAPTTSAIPTWVLAPDGRHAYLILMNDPTLLEIDLLGDGATVAGGEPRQDDRGQAPRLARSP